MKSLELFSGLGGLAEGLRMAGFQHEALLEQNKYACKSLRENFQDITVFETDIRDFDFSKLQGIDIISGGPPCQPFSLGGKAKGNNDERDMFPFAIKGIRELRPKAFLFENVKGLLRKSFASYFRYIILQLQYPDILQKNTECWQKHLERLDNIDKKENYNGLRYKVTYKLMNAANYGIPQKRERVIIVGIRADLGINWQYPNPTHSYQRLLWDKFVTGEYWEKMAVCKADREKLTPKLAKSIESIKKQFGLFAPESKPWVTVRNALSDLPNPNEGKCIMSDHVLRLGAKIYPGHTGSYIDEPSKTLKAGNHGVPGGENMIRFKNDKVRYFTIREAKRIQTFNDEYVVSGSWTEGMRQLGNAVPVQLAYLIGRRLYKQLEQQYALISS